MIENLRRQRLVRDEAVRDFQERVHCQFYRCVAYERRFQAAPENSAYQETMRLRLKRARTRLAAMRKRLAGIRLDATNRQVALALGVPKGTIDSSLSALWKRARAGDARAFQADKGLSLRNRQEVPVSHV
jgi:hypothetical protein